MLIPNGQKSRNQPARPSYRIRFAVTRFGFPDRQQIFPAAVTREFRWQAIEFSSESRGALAISSPKSANFPVFSRGTGNQRAETGSLMTASSANIMRVFNSLAQSPPLAVFRISRCTSRFVGCQPRRDANTVNLVAAKWKLHPRRRPRREVCHRGLLRRPIVCLDA